VLHNEILSIFVNLFKIWCTHKMEGINTTKESKGIMKERNMEIERERMNE
jgi:hypothetical protein